MEEKGESVEEFRSSILKTLQYSRLVMPCPYIRFGSPFAFNKQNTNNNFIIISISFYNLKGRVYNKNSRSYGSMSLSVN